MFVWFSSYFHTINFPLIPASSLTPAVPSRYCTHTLSESCHNQFTITSVWGHLLDILWHGDQALLWEAKEINYTAPHGHWENDVIWKQREDKRGIFFCAEEFFFIDVLIDTESSLVVHHDLKNTNYTVSSGKYVAAFTFSEVVSSQHFYSLINQN